MKENNTIVRVVCAIIRKKDKVLLAKRPKPKEQAGLCEFAGGNVNAQES
jgi:ADP-ribose pyrophosphatase YjhB (NUDIX family)